MSKINFKDSVYKIIKENPNVKELLIDIGFTDLKNKFILNSFGKKMTLEKGAKMKNISLDLISEKLKEHGFEIDGIDDSEVLERKEKLKEYLYRLNNGEDLESVRCDFKETFSEVEAREIMFAEQEMIESGTPLKEVQKLCDLHSALFHGSTKEEQIFNAELEVAASLNKMKDDTLKKILANEAHPFTIFYNENEKAYELVKLVKNDLENNLDFFEDLKSLKEVTIHYTKKGDLLYPHLKVKYDISGPANVMWTVDDEIRDALIRLIKFPTLDEKYYEKLNNTLDRIEEMVYKEKNILFPLLLENFKEYEWMEIYRDMKDYKDALGVEKKIWKEAEKQKEPTFPLDNVVKMPGGELTLYELINLLNALPIEITFINDQDINKYFNEGPKVFKRPKMAIGREVYNCHPPKKEPLVRQIINDLRNGKKDSVDIWMEKEGKPMLVSYKAVRDKFNKFVGTVEIVEDMSFAKEHFDKIKGGN